MVPSSDLPKMAGPEWSPGLLIPSLPSTHIVLEAPAAFSGTVHLYLNLPAHILKLFGRRV